MFSFLLPRPYRLLSLSFFILSPLPTTAHFLILTSHSALHPFSLPSFTSSVAKSLIESEWQDMDRYQASLTGFGLQRSQSVFIASDGNCLPRCVAHFVLGDQERHAELRAVSARGRYAERELCGGLMGSG